jgi:hypothetical protein
MHGDEEATMATLSARRALVAVTCSALRVAMAAGGFADDGAGRARRFTPRMPVSCEIESQKPPT